MGQITALAFSKMACSGVGSGSREMAASALKEKYIHFPISVSGAYVFFEFKTGSLIIPTIGQSSPTITAYVSPHHNYVSGCWKLYMKLVSSTPLHSLFTVALMIIVCFMGNANISLSLPV